MRGCSINAEQVLLECSRCALLMPTLARKSANPGHMSPKFLRCAGCMDCASRRGRILREGGARKQRLLASEKSRPATRSSAALVRLGDAQEAPSNRRLRAAWLARVRPRWQLTSGRGSSHTLNSWPRARLSPLPYTIAAAAATAALVAAATATAVTAGGPLLLPGRRAIIFATKLPYMRVKSAFFFLCRALPRTPSQAELEMSAIFTPLMSGQTPKLGLSADPGPRRPRSEKSALYT